MKAFTKTITALLLTSVTLVILGSFSLWLSVAFLMIFAPDVVSVVVTDYRRTQRRRLLAGLTVVATRTTAALRFEAQ
jgi:hypothetical protein